MTAPLETSSDPTGAAPSFSGNSLECAGGAGWHCAICARDMSKDDWNPRYGPGKEVPPICCICERVSGYDWAGRPRYRTKPTGGSFMDRRNATRILALAEALATTATQIEWSKKHGYA